MILFPNPTPILPTLNGFSVHKKPVWETNVFTSVSGREITAAVAAFPLWEFELTFEALRSQTQNIVTYAQYAGLNEYEQIASIFLACGGQYGQFYYDDPTDNSRTAQVIGTSDGISPTWQITRTFGTGDTSLKEPVGGLNTNLPYQFYVDGTPTSVLLANYNRTITFSPIPSVGALITGDFYYYFLCRFLDDIEDFEQFMYNIWLMKVLKFRSVKP